MPGFVGLANGDRPIGTQVNVDDDAVSTAGKDTADTTPIFKLGYARWSLTGRLCRPNF